MHAGRAVSPALDLDEWQALLAETSLTIPTHRPLHIESHQTPCLLFYWLEALIRVVTSGLGVLVIDGWGMRLRVAEIEQVKRHYTGNPRRL
jgi:hypothetical protein